MKFDFVTKMKYHIKSSPEALEKQGIAYFQARWEFIKFKLTKFATKVSKLVS